MDLTTAKELSKKLKISVPYVIREEYEMLLLKEIFESEFGAYLIFKGGTALRFAYGSPRFSEDLDFNALKGFNGKRFLAFLKGMTKYPSIVGVEVREKFYTAFGLIKVKEEILPHPFSIKIEISKRKDNWVKNRDYSDKIISSETAVFRVFTRTASLERILEEKKDALKKRKAPRDIFDYWFINQALGKEAMVDFSSFDPVEARSELHRLLPKSHWRVVDSWLE